MVGELTLELKKANGEYETRLVSGRQQRNAAIITAIEQIKAEHLFWGYRRVWASLTYHQGHKISVNRVYRLMKQVDLLLKDSRKLLASEAEASS